MNRTCVRRLVMIIGLAGLLATSAAPALAYDQPQDPGGAGVVVALEPGIDPAAVAAAGEAIVLGPLVASRGVWLMDDARGEDAKKAAKRLAKVDGVRYAEEAMSAAAPEAVGRMGAWNRGRATPRPGTPNDMAAQPAAELLGLGSAHELSTGAGVRVAVLDTGLAAASLPGVHVEGGWDMVDDDPDTTDVGDGLDNDGDGMVDEAFGHGTHVAGILALVAPDVTLLPFRVLDADGNGDVHAAVEAIHMAVEQGAQVINISFGAEERSKALERAIKDAEDAGVTLVAAAGNSGDKDKSYPAALSHVIGVAAVDRTGEALTRFSTRGGSVDIAAPGELILSRMPDGFAEWSGTSMASPIVAAQAALILALDPTLDAKDVYKAMKKGVHKVKDAGAGLLAIRPALEHVLR